MSKADWVKAGIMVRFETDGRNGYPRWHFGVDKPKTGEYATGVIMEVKHNVAWMRFTMWPQGKGQDGKYKGDSEAGLWRWPLPGHDEYREDQWERDGWIERISF